MENQLGDYIKYGSDYIKQKYGHYKTSELKELGWTDGLIKKYLGKPDCHALNPVYVSKALMKLYSISRVEEVTQSRDLAPLLAAQIEKRTQRRSRQSVQQEKI